jgi:2-aminoadipate transaminase
MSSTSLDPYTDRYAGRTRGVTDSEIRALFAVASRPDVVSLAGGMPYLPALPMDAVGAMMGDLIARSGATALQYGPGQGYLPLRERTCDVMALEGVVASPDDVVITVGSQQALDMVCRVFIDPGDVVLAEGPSYVGALGTFGLAQAQVVHVPMDDEGLIPAALVEALDRLHSEGRRAKLLYTVPNFHNPAGVTLTLERRTEVLTIAERADLLVLEDNPYGLLGFERGPLPALGSFGGSRVIYLGSFSKTFAPGLRVGWARAPRGVREKLLLVSEAQILCPSMCSQLAVEAYLRTQPWQEQVTVFREIYRERRDAMLEALDALMPAGSTWTKPDGGFYVWLTLPKGLDTKAMQQHGLQAGVAYVPGIGFYADGQGRRDMRLSYCLPEPGRIREGVRRLAGVVAEETEVHVPAGRSHQRKTRPCAEGRTRIASIR